MSFLFEVGRITAANPDWLLYTRAFQVNALLIDSQSV